MAGAVVKNCSDEAASGVLSLCGVAVRADKIRALADRLGPSELAQKLDRGLVNDNTIIALDADERARLVEVLDGPPALLPELRNALVAQLKRINDRERQQQQLRRNQAMGRAQRERSS